MVHVRNNKRTLTSYINITKSWAHQQYCEIVLFCDGQCCTRPHTVAVLRGRRHQQYIVRWLNTIPHRSCYLTRKIFWFGGGIQWCSVVGSKSGSYHCFTLWGCVYASIYYCVTNKSGLLQSIFVRQSVYAQGMRHNKSNVHDIRRTMC